MYLNITIYNNGIVHGKSDTHPRYTAPLYTASRYTTILDITTIIADINIVMA